MTKGHEGSQESIKHASKPLIGAGTGVMVMCLLLVFGYQTIRQPKLEVERRVETSGDFNKKRLPAVVAILDSRTAIGLSESQIQELETIQEEQLRALVPIESQLNEIMSPVKSVDGSKSPMSFTSQEIQVIAKQISGPSKRKREIEKDFSKQAWKVLTQEQQEKALKLSLSNWPLMTRKAEVER